MGSLFQEIRCRKVFRVAAIYAVVAWVLIQVADTIAPLMNLPESAPRLVLFLLTTNDFLTPSTESSITQLVVVDNWFEELKRLAPADPQ